MQTGLWSVPGALAQNEPEPTEEEAEKQTSESGVYRVKLTEIYTGSSFAVHINGPAASSGEFAGKGSDVLSEIESLMSANADELVTPRFVYSHCPRHHPLRLLVLFAKALWWHAFMMILLLTKAAHGFVLVLRRSMAIQQKYSSSITVIGLIFALVLYSDLS